METIKLNKKFYTKEAVDQSIKDFENMVKLEEENDYYILSAEDQKTLLEFSNYVLAMNLK